MAGGGGRREGGLEWGKELQRDGHLSDPGPGPSPDPEPGPSPSVPRAQRWVESPA